MDNSTFFMSVKLDFVVERNPAEEVYFRHTFSDNAKTKIYSDLTEKVLSIPQKLFVVNRNPIS